jgi:hypothetical protein
MESALDGWRLRTLPRHLVTRLSRTVAVRFALHRSRSIRSGKRPQGPPRPRLARPRPRVQRRNLVRVLRPAARAPLSPGRGGALGLGGDALPLHPPHAGRPAFGKIPPSPAASAHGASIHGLLPQASSGPPPPLGPPRQARRNARLPNRRRVPSIPEIRNRRTFPRTRPDIENRGRSTQMREIRNSNWPGISPCESRSPEALSREYNANDRDCGEWPERHARFSPRIAYFEGSSWGNRQNLFELGVAHAKRVVLTPRRAGFSRREKPRSGVEAIPEAWE